MPFYSFICPECGNRSDIFQSIQNRPRAAVCGECHSDMIRDYSEEKVNTGNKEYGSEIHSDSLAIMPSQVKEHQQKFPDVKIDNEGRPVFDNYQQHDKYLEQIGAVKMPQKIKHKKSKKSGSKKQFNIVYVCPVCRVKKNSDELTTDKMPRCDTCNCQMQGRAFSAVIR